ncbi:MULTISPECIES: maleylpyruvate isomerase N-terminal domain-containing protein [unclassified Nocardioides]|jgi:uncharacterized protein (TIGR03083 family)|uniref:maleylpyruvate isomerase N-terminal domain-containing protein n=1 Tax=unclassified Nocardioides TaxID=2615069 RepID=UPI000702A1FE|nr:MULTISPECIES: maleylpyruvate isomerase N-terminal domain-containing protein [unclassified Nocardioides]KRC50186.1 hypothetical protein ASE19_16400 [Nocardioides sp. Root79]KRC75653.1 hypothetical protein ASE20_22420 [Nocardioides sp. Root240]
MTRLGDAAYLDHIRTESARFADVLATCDPAARVPSCPDWDATDLLWHLAEVQHFWHHVITHRPAPPEDYADPVRPATHDEVLAFFRATHDAFVEALAAADPAEAAWSWSTAEDSQRVGFTYRRQAHEALIHRLDAELAAGVPTALDAALAADGVDEALDVMYGGLPDWGRFEPEPLYVEYRATDTGASVWTQLGTFGGTAPDGTVRSGEPDQHVVPAPGRAADVVVTGTADQLDGWLWHRYDDSGITVEGAPEVWARAAAVLGQAID